MSRFLVLLSISAYFAKITISINSQSSKWASSQLFRKLNICNANFYRSFFIRLFCILISSTLSNSTTWFVKQKIFRRIYRFDKNDMNFWTTIFSFMVFFIWNLSSAFILCDEKKTVCEYQWCRKRVYSKWSTNRIRCKHVFDRIDFDFVIAFDAIIENNFFLFFHRFHFSFVLLLNFKQNVTNRLFIGSLAIHDFF